MKHLSGKALLVVCEESQAVCNAFRAAGWIAFSCDLQPCSGGHPEWHIVGDALKLINGDCKFTTESGDSYIMFGQWDMIISHPPCTYLTKCGACRTFPNGGINEERLELGIEAAAFFMEIWNCKCDRVCIENPVPMHVFNLPPYSQIVCPSMFGADFKITTCLWLRGLPGLMATYIDMSATPTSKADWWNKGGKERQKNRSKTWVGLAEAMANQWG